MTQPKNHLTLAASDGQTTATAHAAGEAALMEMIEDLMVERIMAGKHLWNPETGMIIDAEQAADVDRLEVEAATQRHFDRVRSGEPLSSEATAMHAAFRRMAARQRAGGETR